MISFIRDLGDNDLKQHFIESGKNATYVSHFTVDEFIKIISNHIEQKTLRDLLVSADFSLLADKSTDEAGRAQLSMFVRFVEMTTNSPTEQFICVRKLGASKTSEAIMLEIEEMFSEKHINKTFIRFSGLDGTNCMSGVQNGLQRRIQHVSPYAFYINCRNPRLALCLVHLLKEYGDLDAVDILLLSIWKTFKYSSVKQAIFENAQVLDGLPPLNNIKSVYNLLAHPW